MTIKGSKRSRPPPKFPRNAPLYVLPQTKKNLQDSQNQRYIGIFMSPEEREREREQERESDRERGGERERERERGKERERERERERKKSPGD
jgi:hypothetical protein